ncbi:MAG TPA: SpoIIE family protein phosphatase, partial [Planctomycetota bacterium]|nr:SpoIIE family protein phosphatase [Planctomycetota bacterium]
SRNEPVATATGKRSFEKTITEGQQVHDGGAETAGVDVLEFEYDGLPVRSFSLRLRPAPAPDPGLAGSPGRIEVYISASEIEDARRKLARAMIQVTAASCVAASIGAFLLARFLTRPIRALLKDMKHVALGHLGHQSSVQSSDELGELAHAFNAMTASLQEAQEAKLTQKALEHELALATQIQERLLPRTMPQLEGFDITHHYQPAREVGGDYYDFVKIDAEHVGFVVADVSGKGIPASLVMTMTRTLLRSAACGEISPARTVEMVNRSLTPDMRSGMFVTLVYFVLNVKTREVRLVRSGHNPPLVYSTRHQKLLHLRPRGMALGLDREGSLFLSELKVQRLTLQPGDVLVAHTDGIVEGKSREGMDYSDARLEEVIAANAAGSASRLVQAIVADLAEHERGTEPSDDVTLLVLKAT